MVLKDHAKEALTSSATRLSLENNNFKNQRLREIYLSNK
ncbi:hypothetical protein EBME_0509 [bacterium endosymbiont of Mortierella elongata FMR23-6]|nr:hypothetical protein EBME_0509 [bacterium endosymbiont of Mortierella elongata FMR23-6]